MRYVIVVRPTLQYMLIIFRLYCLMKLLMKQTVRSQLTDVTESIASGNLENT